MPLAHDGWPRRVYFTRGTKSLHHVRMQLEALVALCAITHRHLVLPAPSKVGEIEEFHELNVWSGLSLQKVIKISSDDTAPSDAHVASAPFWPNFHSLPQDRDWWFEAGAFAEQRFVCLPLSNQDAAVATAAVFQGLRLDNSYVDMAMGLLEKHHLKPGAYIGLHLGASGSDLRGATVQSVQHLTNATAGMAVLLASDVSIDDPLLQDLARTHVVVPIERLYKSAWDSMTRVVVETLLLAFAYMFVGTPSDPKTLGVQQLRVQAFWRNGDVDLKDRFFRDPPGDDACEHQATFSKLPPHLATARADTLLKLPTGGTWIPNVQVHSSSPMVAQSEGNGPIVNILSDSKDFLANFGGEGNSDPSWVIFDTMEPISVVGLVISCVVTIPVGFAVDVSSGDATGPWKQLGGWAWDEPFKDLQIYAGMNAEKTVFFPETQARFWKLRLKPQAIGNQPQVGYARLLPKAGHWWPAVQPQRYERSVKGGICGEGLTVGSFAECARAMRLLGGEVRSSRTDATKDLPAGCFAEDLLAGVGMVFSIGSGTQGRSNLAAVCRTAQPLSASRIAEQLGPLPEEIDSLALSVVETAPVAMQNLLGGEQLLGSIGQGFLLGAGFSVLCGLIRRARTTRV